VDGDSLNSCVHFYLNSIILVSWPLFCGPAKFVLLSHQLTNRQMHILTRL
jgi:hypothetical protein